MNKHKKLSAKLFFTLLIGISLVIIAALYIEFRLSKNYIHYRNQSLSVNNIRYRILELNDELETIRRLTRNTATLTSSVKMDSLQIEELHRLIFNVSDEIHGIGIFVYKKVPQSALYTKYFYRDDTTLRIMHTLPYPPDSLGLNKKGIQLIPVHRNWCDSLLVFHSQNNSLNVNKFADVTIDLKPDFIYSSLGDIARSYRTEYLILDRNFKILFTNRGFLSGDIQEKIMNNEITSYQSLLGNYLKKNSEIFISSKDYNKKTSVFYLPLTGIGWQCLFFISDNKMDRTLVLHFLLVSILSILAITIAGIIINYYSRKLTGPLSLIIRALKNLENGNLSNYLPDIETDDELEEIANSFQKVQAKMRHYASGFKNSLEEKRALKHDLRVASKIQESMLPDQFQGLLDFPSINLFTRLVPAKGVAGDFFDYCFLDKDRFFFVVGDVSGKGIPAALYMVKVLTLLRTEKIRSLPLSGMFTEISKALMNMNEEGIFVTAVGGILNFKTGEMELCDAGHNAPLISQRGKAFTSTGLKKNVPLGVIASSKYEETRIQFQSRDALFLFTDGLPEAEDENGNMFGSERITQALTGQQDKKLEIIFNYLKNNLLDFVGKAKQTDDITLFFLRYIK